jgi:hypothetical protein
MGARKQKRGSIRGARYIRRRLLLDPVIRAVLMNLRGRAAEVCKRPFYFLHSVLIASPGAEGVSNPSSRPDGLISADFWIRFLSPPLSASYPRSCPYIPYLSLGSCAYSITPLFITSPLSLFFFLVIVYCCSASSSHLSHHTWSAPDVMYHCALLTDRMPCVFQPQLRIVILDSTGSGSLDTR